MKLTNKQKGWILLSPFILMVAAFIIMVLWMLIQTIISVPIGVIIGIIISIIIVFMAIIGSYYLDRKD